MRFDQAYTARQIANWINAKLIGDPHQEFLGMNEIHKVESGDIMFVDVSKYFKKALNSNATGIILNEEIEPPAGKCLFIHDDPFRAYEALGARFYKFEPLNANIHHTAKIHPSVHLEPGVRIGADVEIGQGSLIQANTVIGSKTKIGKNVWIQPNCTIGSEAFYYKKEEGQYHKWTTLGEVIIEDDVTIGANCTIDKGVSGITRIGQGSKLDNQIHIAHGVVIGKNCLIAAQCGIAGKTILGDGVTLLGQVGLVKSLHIGDGVTVLSQAGVINDLEAGKSYWGMPAKETRDRMREIVTLKKLAQQKK